MTVKLVFQCQCGMWSGVECQQIVEMDSAVIVQFMPHHLRGSHRAARNSGMYPFNGAKRFIAHPGCADVIIEEDEWAEIIPTDQKP